MNKVEIRRQEAVALLLSLGLFRADTWPPDKLSSYLSRLDEVGDYSDLSDPRLRYVYKRCNDAARKGVRIEVDCGGSKPNGRKVLLPPGIAPPQLPKHKRIKPERKTFKKPGVVDSIIDMLLTASEDSPVTKPDMLEKLVEQFGPDTPYGRSPAGMLNTLSGLGTWIGRPEHARRGIKLHRNAHGWWAVIELVEE
jgi:hypothetical protein